MGVRNRLIAVTLGVIVSLGFGTHVALVLRPGTACAGDGTTLHDSLPAESRRQAIQESTSELRARLASLERSTEWLQRGKDALERANEHLQQQLREAAAAASSAPTQHPLPSPLDAPSAEGCHAMPNTEMAAGSVVKWGADYRVNSSGECCAACKATPGCTTWVHCTSAEHCGEQHWQCWLKHHDDPWLDIRQLRGSSRAWTTGIVGSEPPGFDISTRSCARAPRASATGPLQPAAPGVPLEVPHYRHVADGSVHGDEWSRCPPVAAAEASLKIVTPAGVLRLRLNDRSSPVAAAWIRQLAQNRTCGAWCKPHCCQFYRGEPVLGVHPLPAALLRAYQVDPEQPPHFGRGFFWGPPYAFLQGRLWNLPSGPPNLPSEGTAPVLHRGAVELVGEGPDFLIALADHPLMPPHNVFAHVVQADLPLLDRIITEYPLKVENWGSINATVFAPHIDFDLLPIAPGEAA